MEELILERQLNSKTFLNEDGTRTLQYYGKPIHYDKNGILQEIDVNFYPNTTSNPAYYLFNTENNSFRIGLSEDLSIPRSIKFSFRYDGVGDLYTTIGGLALYDSEKDEYTIFTAPQQNVGIAEGNKVTYTNVYQGIDAEFISLDDQLKENVYINDISMIPNPADFGYNPETTSLIFLHNLETNMLELNYTGEQIEAYNEGVRKLTAPKEWAKDANQTELTMINNYNQGAGIYYFGIPLSELQTARLPILIDPTWETVKVEDSNNKDTAISFDNNSSSMSSYFESANNDALYYGETYEEGYDPEFGSYWSSALNRSLLKLDFTPFNINPQYVSKAELITNNVLSARVWRINSDWTNMTAQQKYNVVISGSTHIVTANSNTTDVTSAVKYWLSNPSFNYGFGFEKDELRPTQGFSGLSVSTVSLRPYVRITYAVAVTGFTGTPRTSDSIKWTWNTITEAEKYVIYDNNNVKLGEVPAGTLEWTETGLSPNTSYTRKVRVVIGGVESTDESVATQTTYKILVLPQSLPASGITSNAITWNWLDRPNQVPLFDSGQWTKTGTATVTYSSPTSMTMTTDGTASRLTIRKIVSQNTNYEFKWNRVSGSYGAVYIFGVQQNSDIVSNSTNYTITFNSGQNTQVDISFALGGSFTSVFELIGLFDLSENQNATGYEILDKNGVLLQSTNASTKTWTESNLRYETAYERYVKVVRNSEKSAGVLISATTAVRPSTPETKTATIYPSADTHVSSFNPTVNANNSLILTVGRSSASSLFRAFLKFPLSLGSDITLNNAKLRLTSTNSNFTSRVWKISKITSNWDSTTLTWDNQPNFLSTGDMFNEVRAIAPAGVHEFSLNTTIVQSWLTNPSSNYGMVFLNDEQQNVLITFHSLEVTTESNRPQLILNYTIPLAPQKPTNFTGSILSANTIRWSWTAGDNTATEYRIYNADTDQLIGATTSTSFDESGKVFGNTYNRYVTAYNTGGETPITQTSYLFDQLPPNNIIGSPQSSSRILWSFDSNGFSEYKIYQFENSIATLIARVRYEGGVWNAYLESNLTTPIASYVSPNFLQSGLPPNTMKQIKVSSVGIAESNLSSPASATTHSLPIMSTLSGQKLGLNNLKWTIT